jgi:citrate synthase
MSTFTLQLLCHVLGIDSDIFTLIFAMSRMAGWIAHVQEQRKE